MNRRDLQEISRVRLREARVLMKAGHYSGAYYILGYAVECALKACISKKTRKHDFPDKKFANDVFTHDLDALMRLAGVEESFKQDAKSNRDLDANWNIVKDWKEDTRYGLSKSKGEARNFLSACTGPNGILSWIKKRW